MNKIIKSAILFSIILVLVPAAMADPQAPEWVDFFGTITINGNPAPIGTDVKAYDPGGTMCGEFTVNTVGNYGFLHANRDDITTGGVDEGADPGEIISFKINGLDAIANVINGDITWTSHGVQNEVNLELTTQTVSFSILNAPADTLGYPGFTYRFFVDIQNDGDGLDYYGVSADDDTSVFNAWTVTNQDTLSYADPTLATSVWFDITLPVFGGGPDTAHLINYTVFSQVDPGVTYAGSLTIYKTITDVGDEAWSIIPDRFNLFQNYPNPFNPTTTIAFSLPGKSSVQLEIINIRGQIVDVRNMGVLPSGLHEIEYDASSLSSGVYFYRLHTNDNTISKKMVLLK